ncbi:M56 family metallopeptidase [Clostridium estertheticum]|uniref:M56 family metallopeptidase n=1 Tax=Clostridium estertheticum TaxID=238834 RepID=UPI0013EEE52F|nr:M56 family metallopeptidase [Clostridium estertheticum]MBZ9607285.1 M56 family metallopeptidase [Clostridium estertheticum]
MISIFKEVLNISLYVSILILIVIVLKEKFLSKYTSTFNYILCIGISLRCIFIRKIIIPMPEFLKSISYIENSSSIGTIVEPNNNIDYLKIICCIWIIGAILTAMYYTCYHFKLYINLNNLKKEITDNSIYNLLEKHKKDLNIKRNIKVYKLDGIYSPMIVGFIKSEIIIPNRDYTYNDLNYVFRHELIHYKRKDNILKLILTVATIIHWFNPIIHLFKKYYNDQCELSCDELVTKKFTLNEIKEYSLLLLDTMKYKNKLNSSMFVSYLNLNKSNIIKSRIDQILSNKKRKNGKIAAIVLVVAIMASIVSFRQVVYRIHPSFNSEINTLNL